MQYAMSLNFLKIPIDIQTLYEYNERAGRDALYTREVEFAFKCHIMAPTVGTAVRRFFFLERIDLEFCVSDKVALIRAAD